MIWLMLVSSLALHTFLMVRNLTSDDEPVMLVLALCNIVVIIVKPHASRDKVLARCVQWQSTVFRLVCAYIVCPVLS